MSTELKTVKAWPVSRSIGLLQFCAGKQFGRCLQLKQFNEQEPNPLGLAATPNYIKLTKPEALRLAGALIEWANDERERL